MKKLLIIDTSAIMYRSHYALFRLVNTKGMHTGAVFGFVKQLEIAIKNIEPDYIAAAFDVSRSGLKRLEIFKEYKSNRTGMPEELVPQLEIIRDIIDAYGIEKFTCEGYEADDVIASLAEYAKNNNMEAHIVTGDKDLQQLISDDEKVFIHFLGKDIIIKNRKEVKEYINVYPEYIPDFFGLKGDASDGIPGVKGIGEVAGSKLINEYSTLENLYEHIEEIKGKMKEKLINDKELAFISRELAIVNKNLDLNVNIEKLSVSDKDIPKLKQIYKDLELNQLYKQLDEETAKEKKDLTFNIVTKNEIINIVNNSKEITLYTDDNFLNIIDDNENIYSSEPFDLSEFNPNVYYNLFDAKKYMHENLKLKDNFFDNLIAAYIINTHSKFYIEDILEHYLHINIPIYGKTLLKKTTKEELRKNSIKITLGIFELRKVLEKKLKKLDTMKTYDNIEKPLISVLYNMEKEGIMISKEKFDKLNIEFSKITDEYEKKIFEIAGCEFNLDSPKQLAEILFEKLNIKTIKKTKTGYSTDASVLEELSLRGIEIADYILTYREYKKLVSTYIESIPKFADKNLRVHSVFNGTGTVTGRLSSLNPNLQNIPARNENGNKIRACFIAKKGYKLVSFDYSQIELRVLAELSKDPALLEAYNNDLDLHEQTARKIFEKYEGKISKNERDLAKIINFSVLYGKTAYGLSKELKININDARKYINAYFEKYTTVRTFLDKIIEKANENVYVETLFGSKRYINGLKSSNSFVLEQAKRMAINTVIQGTAANILKIVMIKLNNLGYNILVQVHDELIFEIKEDNVEKQVKEIKEIMENTIKFENVKLKVNYTIGDNWGELK
ncbi:DNA polymerase [Oceanivirga salmonicida]|uniref:DNA polymerase n=1 Tax=Oceanivirga salmonicida TaxID=1769291 RepID=UPI0012E229D2|nr:DNA polymerase [Oceanivirga salmonicida]